MGITGWRIRPLCPLFCPRGSGIVSFNFAGAVFDDVTGGQGQGRQRACARARKKTGGGGGDLFEGVTGGEGNFRKRRSRNLQFNRRGRAPRPLKRGDQIGKLAKNILISWSRSFRRNWIVTNLIQNSFTVSPPSKIRSIFPHPSENPSTRGRHFIRPFGARRPYIFHLDKFYCFLDDLNVGKDFREWIKLRRILINECFSTF